MSTPEPRIVHARLEPYELPFAQPWRTARGETRVRAGWLVHLRDDRGATAVGESAPWPAAGTETPGECAKALKTLLDELPGRAVSEALAALPPPSPAPAARCGVEAALLGLAAGAAGCPVRRLLSPDAATVLSVNAACGIADGSLAARVSEAATAGFRVFKVKIGVRDWTEELRRLRALSLPRGTGLRLDANGAWSADEAAARLADLAGLPVESLEEPLAVFEAGTLARLQAGVEFSLALDESLAAGAQDLLDAGCPVRRIVLKPTVIGGAAPSIALARRAAALGIEVVVTTTLEAAPGRQLVAETAAASGSRLAHGLDTGRWLGRDLARGPRIERGRIRLDEG